MASPATQMMDTKIPDIDYLLMIFGMANGANVINKAMELDIFELLYKEKGPISAEELAKRNKFKPDVLARLLNCLASLKVVTKTTKDGKVLYKNTNAGDLLSKSNPQTFKAMPWWNSFIGPCLEGIVNKVKIQEDGEKKEEEEEYDWDECEADRDLYQGFHNFLVPQAKSLVTKHDLSQYKTCVDLGGGSGAISFELKRNYPEMDITIFDLKNVVKLAKEHFIPGNEHLGIKFIEGNFFKTPFPKVDLFVICRTLRTMGSTEVNDLLTKCHQSLNAGGAVLALEQMQNEDKAGSISATINDIIVLSDGGSLLNPSEFKALFTKHGFTDIQCTFTQEWNEYDIIYAKKA